MTRRSKVFAAIGVGLLALAAATGVIFSLFANDPGPWLAVALALAAIPLWFAFFFDETVLQITVVNNDRPTYRREAALAVFALVLGPVLGAVVFLWVAAARPELNFALSISVVIVFSYLAAAIMGAFLRRRRRMRGVGAERGTETGAETGTSHVPPLRKD